MKCPYCDSEIENGITVCPHCMAELEVSEIVNKDEVNNSVSNDIKIESISKKNYTKYFIVMGIMVIVLAILGVLIGLKMNPEKKNNTKTTAPITTDAILKEMTLNTGIFSGKENPLPFGSMTIASIYDESTKTTKLVDVMITRYLNENEVLEIAQNNNQTLKEGFVFVGVEYNVYFHDLSYLGNRTISPVLEASILESKLFNDFFLVNGHYYKSDVISVYNGPNIKNEESATVKLVYQVPIGQNYYICLGSDASSLGCFSN